MYPSLWRSSNRKLSVNGELGSQKQAIRPRTINLGTRMEDLARVMRESREMNTVFLAGNRFVEFALSHIINMHTVIVTGTYQNIALVVKVQRGHVFGQVFFTRIKSL